MTGLDGTIWNGTRFSDGLGFDWRNQMWQNGKKSSTFYICRPPISKSHKKRLEKEIATSLTVELDVRIFMPSKILNRPFRFASNFLYLAHIIPTINFCARTNLTAERSKAGIVIMLKVARVWEWVEDLEWWMGRKGEKWERWVKRATCAIHVLNAFFRTRKLTSKFSFDILNRRLLIYLPLSHCLSLSSLSYTTSGRNFT